jgi:hypothetical protein
MRRDEDKPKKVKLVRPAGTKIIKAETLRGMLDTGATSQLFQTTARLVVLSQEGDAEKFR